MTRLITTALVGATLILAGCGKGMENRAVATCERAIGEKLSGKTFVLDKKDMLSKAKHDGDDIIQVSTFVVFDQGLASESKQGVDCRVEFNPKDRAAEPTVVGLTFTW